MNKENIYLEYLKIYHNNKHENGSLFRGFVDDWFAYSYRNKKDNPFLNSKGNPKWFNNPNPIKEKDALLQMHFVSKEAMQIINGKISGRLIKDHAVPIYTLRKLMRNKLRDNADSHEIRQFLDKFYTLGVISKGEDDVLNSTQYKLKSNMPDDWDEKNMFARYEKAKIK